MSLLAFVNMISSCAPPRKGETHLPGVIGIAIAVEDESGEIVRTVVRRVTLPLDRELNTDWTAKYGIPALDQLGEAVKPAQAAGEALAALEGVTQAAAHFVHFHKEHLRLLIDDGGARFDVLSDLDWFDTMHKATLACKIPGRSSGAYKPPSLNEAAAMLTGSGLPALDGLTWQEAMLAHLTAVRGVWRALNGRDVPAEPIRELPQEAMP